MGNNCATSDSLCCQRPALDDEKLNPASRVTEREQDILRRQKPNVLEDPFSNNVITNENRRNFREHEKLALYYDSFLVCQKRCKMANTHFLDFSQKRFTGFRNFYEFEQKRVMIANDR